jgi:hypothetical protein
MRADATDQKIVSLAGAVVAAMAEASGRPYGEEAFSALPGFEGAYKLDSRKGTCFELRFAGRPPIFAKALENEQKAENERVCAGLLNDAGISCPTVLAKAGNAIARRFIEGNTASVELDTILSWGDCPAALRLCSKIGGILRQVHGIQTHEGLPLALNDLTLKNFIVSSRGELSLIDLEEAGIGRAFVDLGALIVHILTHRPSFSELSWQMAEAAFAGYCGPAGPDFSEEEWKEGQEAAIKDASSRRKDPTLIELMPGMLVRISEWKMTDGGGGRFMR